MHFIRLKIANCVALFATFALFVPPIGCSKKKPPESPSVENPADNSFFELAAYRLQSSNNLKRICLGFADYALANHYNLPDPAIFDANGKPLLSWRVAILPFIDEGELYKQFKLDEPWDSEHNKKLISKMPNSYLLPGKGSETDRVTPYRIFVSEPSAKYDKQQDLALFLWTDPKTRKAGHSRYGIGVIPDGTSNTILLVEAAESVVWTKPDELVYDPNKPLPKLGYYWNGRCQVIRCDGTVWLIDKGVDERFLRAGITPNDAQFMGEWDKYATKP